MVVKLEFVFLMTRIKHRTIYFQWPRLERSNNAENALETLLNNNIKKIFKSDGDRLEI